MNKKIDIAALNAALATPSPLMLTDTQLGRRPNSGISMPEDQRIAIGKANMGVSRAMPAWTDERKAAASEVTSKRIAERNARRATGEEVRVYSEQARRNIGLAAKGRQQSEESRRKRSESMKRTLARKKLTSTASGT